MAVILLSVSQISAQQVLPGGTVVTDASVTRYRDSVRIGLVMDLTDVRVESGRSVVIQPRYVGEDGGESAYLPPVEVMGRARSLYLKRNPEAASMDKVYCRILKQRKEPQQVAYEVTLPYAEWMDRSRLQVVEDRCGCGKIDQGTLTELLRADLAFRPRLAYVVPQAEPVKTRELSGRSYLDFRVFPGARPFWDPHIHSRPSRQSGKGRRRPLGNEKAPSPKSRRCRFGGTDPPDT